MPVPGLADGLDGHEQIGAWFAQQQTVKKASNRAWKKQSQPFQSSAISREGARRREASVNSGVNSGMPVSTSGMSTHLALQR